jgi:hypothetical protein
MKKLNYILMAGVALLAAACVSDEEDLFDKSAAQRMNEMVGSNTKLLESSEEGWVFNYYLGTDAILGGIAHTVRFSDGQSFFRSELTDDVTVEYPSLYQVKGEQECLLSFDTYNDAFHYWSGPIGGYNSGYSADYEFAFKNISADQDTITLKGKKYGTYAQLIRLKGENAGEEYITKAAEMTDNIDSYPHPKMIAAGKEYSIDMGESVLYYSIEGSDENGLTTYESHTLGYVSTPEGIHFYSPVTVGKESAQDFVYDEETNGLTAVGADISMPCIYPEGYVSYDDYIGTYTTTLTTGSTVEFTIDKGPDKKTLLINGMTYTGLPVTVNYSPKSGNITIYSQELGEWGSYNIWLIVYFDPYVSWSTSYGMIGTLGEEDGQTVVTFESNSSSLEITTFFEYAFTGTPSGDTMAGSTRRFAPPLKFVKK